MLSGIGSCVCGFSCVILVAGFVVSVDCLRLHELLLVLLWLFMGLLVALLCVV